MRHFGFLVEVLRTSGLYAVDENPSDPSSRLRPPTDYEWDVIEHCQPFVFTLGASDKGGDPLLLAKHWDAPFQVFSLETAEYNPLSTTTPQGANGNPVSIFCIVVSEYKPNLYDFYALVGTTKAIEENKFTLHTNPRVIKTRSTSKKQIAYICDQVLFHYLDRLKTQAVGAQAARTPLKIGTGKAKRIRRLNRVIHVAPKSKVAKNPEAFRNVDWTHRFAVRGHWLTLGPGRLGKDREGNYCIPGETWREEYVKNDKHLPFIKKVRIVKETDNETQPGSDFQSEKHPD